VLAAIAEIAARLVTSLIGKNLRLQERERYASHGERLLRSVGESQTSKTFL